MKREAITARHYPSRPWCAVGVVIIHQERTLLIRRQKPPRQRQWSLPGGAQRIGETLFETAVREVQEEAGMIVTPMGIIDAVDSIQRDDAGNVEWHYTLIDIVAIPADMYSADSCPAVHPGSDALEARWTDDSTLADLPLWEETRRIIKQAKAMLRDHKLRDN